VTIKRCATMWKQIGSGLLHSDSRPDVSPHLGREAERILASLVNGGYETQTRLAGTMRNNDRQGGEANQPSVHDQVFAPLGAQITNAHNIPPLANGGKTSVLRHKDGRIAFHNRKKTKTERLVGRTLRL
jgi:hypothetical protein